MLAIWLANWEKNVPFVTQEHSLYTLSRLLIFPLFSSFKEPPPLSGALEPNVKLRQAERLFENQLVGPESIANIGGKHRESLRISHGCLFDCFILKNLNACILNYKGLFDSNSKDFKTNT